MSKKTILSAAFVMCVLISAGTVSAAEGYPVFDFEQKSLISNYLSAALSGNNFLPLRNFILASMAFLVCVWLLSLLLLLVKKIERNKHER